MVAVIATLSAHANPNIAGPGPAIMGGGGNITGLRGGGVVDANRFNNLSMPQRTMALEQAVCARFDECARHIDMEALAAGRVQARERPGGADMPRCTEVLVNCFAQSGVSYRNCDAMLRRCVLPRCSAGCPDANLVLSIIEGCMSGLQPVMALGCRQFPALPGALAAEIANMGLAAQQRAAAEAQAAAAAQATNNAQADAMQQQMMAMQQQMAAQQAAAAQQQQALIQEMTAAQQQAQAAAVQVATMPVDARRAELLAREQASGQIMSEIQRMEGALAALKKSMTTVFDYAKCDYRGENCGEVRRIAAFREKTNRFFHPFDEAIDRIMDVVDMGMALGADMNNIYMLLEGACSRWGLYMAMDSCPSGQTVTAHGLCMTQPDKTNIHGRITNRLIRPINSGEEVFAEFAIPASEKNGLQRRNDNMVVGCMSESATSRGMFGRRRARADAIDIEPLRHALSLVDRNNACHCAGKEEDSRNICIGGIDIETGRCVRNNINVRFAMCPVHANNRTEADEGMKNVGICFSQGTEPDKELIVRRASAITGEMFRQYNQLEIIAKQIRTMTHAAVLTAASEQAGASAGGSAVNAHTICNEADQLDNLNCLVRETGNLLAQVSSAARPERAMIDMCNALVNRQPSSIAIKVPTTICGASGRTMTEGLVNLQDGFRNAAETLRNNRAIAGAGGMTGFDRPQQPAQ